MAQPLPKLTYGQFCVPSDDCESSPKTKNLINESNINCTVIIDE